MPAGMKKKIWANVQAAKPYQALVLECHSRAMTSTAANAGDCRISFLENCLPKFFATGNSRLMMLVCSANGQNGILVNANNFYCDGT